MTDPTPTPPTSAEDCTACFGTGWVHAGKSEPERCRLCAAGTPGLPPEALTAAAEAVARELRKMPGRRDDSPQIAENIRALGFDLAAAALDAAQPHLTAAAWKDFAQFADKYHAAYPVVDPTANHLNSFGDLIRKKARDG